MIRNLFFFLLGAGTGAYATLQAQKKAREVTPENVGRRVGRQAADRGVDIARQLLAFATAAADGLQERTSEHLDARNAAASPTTQGPTTQGPTNAQGPTTTGNGPASTPR